MTSLPPDLLPTPVLDSLTTALQDAQWDTLNQVPEGALPPLSRATADDRRALDVLSSAITRAPKDQQVALSDWLVRHYPEALFHLGGADMITSGGWDVLEHWYPALNPEQRLAWAQSATARCWMEDRHDWAFRFLPDLAGALDQPASVATLSELLEGVLILSGKNEDIQPVLDAFATQPKVRAEATLTFLLERWRPDLAEQVAEGVDLFELNAGTRYDIVLAALRTGQWTWIERLVPRPPVPGLYAVEAQVGWVAEAVEHAPDALPWLKDRLEWNVIEQQWANDLVEDQVHDAVVDWIACASPTPLCERWADRFPGRLPKAMERLDALAREQQGLDRAPRVLSSRRRRT